jgi:hypothetical protein
MGVGHVAVSLGCGQGRPATEHRAGLLASVSHFFLDGLVHVAGLPLAGENSPKFGVGLWKHMPLELCLETLMEFVAMAIYWKTAGAAASAVRR